jgi:hypothetical protein
MQMTDLSTYFHRVVLHAIIVLSIGLIAGLMLTFSLLDAVNLWPLPVWEVSIPGSDRGWATAHVGGILNGILLIALINLATKLELSLGSWSLIITGWANTIFYWAGNLAPNRGLSVDDTIYGSADIWGAIAFLSGGGGMFFTFFVMYLLGRAAMRKC